MLLTLLYFECEYMPPPNSWCKDEEANGIKEKDTPEENISMLRRSGECAKEREEDKKKTR